MGKIELKDKLRKFLTKSNPFLEEKDVVYFLVEVRKTLDHIRKEKTDTFKVLRFYCDWILHTEKTSIIKEIKSIMDKIVVEENSINKKSVALKQFINMEELKNELNSFVLSHGLLDSNISESVWVNFHKLLIEILSDQPMILKVNSSGITQFQFRAYKNMGYSVEYDIIP